MPVYVWDDLETVESLQTSNTDHRSFDFFNSKMSIYVFRLQNKKHKWCYIFNCFDWIINVSQKSIKKKSSIF